MEGGTKRYKNDIQKLNDLNSMVIKADELINSKSAKVTFEGIAKNKLTYLDFWASWCLPCRAEMPSSVKLSEEYQSKGINFIYISIDKNPVAWEKAVKQMGLKNENSYLLPGGEKSTIAKHFGISFIPRYMIMDSKGRIINQDAPRPSSSNIREVFEDLLKR